MNIIGQEPRELRGYEIKIQSILDTTILGEVTFRKSY